jgi:hypothetical protein
MAYKIKRKSWEKIGTIIKPRFMEMYGKKNEKAVVWVDKWQKGNYAVISGEEVKPSTYKEKQTIANVGSMKEAKKIQKEYMGEY